MAMSVVYTNFNSRIVKESRGGVERYYAPDTLGSTALLLDSTGTVTDTFTYWPFGEVRSHTGTSTTPFTFVGTLGYYFSLAANWFYVRARFYQQTVGRWLTVDPLWPKLGAYDYVLNSPVTFVEPSGMQAAPPTFFPAGPQPSLPITCGGQWNSWVYAYCNNCYYGSVRPINCVGVCNFWAGQYYDKCNAHKYPGWPFGPGGILRPPTGFQPVPGGGVIVPVRPGCPITSSSLPPAASGDCYGNCLDEYSERNRDCVVQCGNPGGDGSWPPYYPAIGVTLSWCLGASTGQFKNCLANC